MRELAGSQALASWWARAEAAAQPLARGTREQLVAMLCAAGAAFAALARSLVGSGRQRKEKLAEARDGMQARASSFAV